MSLLYDFEGIGDATGPEGVPDAVDLVANIAGEHGASPSVAMSGRVKVVLAVFTLGRVRQHEVERTQKMLLLSTEVP